jgi:hypothetical protein
MFVGNILLFSRSPWRINITLTFIWCLSLYQNQTEERNSSAFSPETAFSLFPPVHRADPEGQQRGRYHPFAKPRRMAGTCAFLPKTAGRGWIVHPAATLLPDVASHVDHSWPRMSDSVRSPLSCPRSPPHCDPPAAPKGGGDRRSREPPKGDRPTLVDADMA